LLAVTAVCAGCSSSPSSPDDSGQTVEERIRAAFLEDHKLDGKPALIEVGLVGCELSDKGLEEMITMQSRDLVRGLAYARIEASKDGKAADEYYAKKVARLKFPIFRDTDGAVAKAFDATIYPIFLLVDKFGNIRYRGAFPDENLGEWTQMLLAEKTDPGRGAAMLGVKELDGPKLLASTKLPALDGADKALGDYLTRGMMAVFVDTNCPYSAQAIGDVPSVSNTLGKAGVPTVVVNITDPEEEVKAFYAKRQLSVPVVYDVTPGARFNWDVQSVPTIIFFDTQGKIAYKGPAVWADVARAGERALGLRTGSLGFKPKGTRYG